MSSNIFGPTGTSTATDVSDSGESGHHYYFIKEGLDIKIAAYQQYPIHERNYIEMDGTIEMEEGSEIILGDD